MFWKTDTPYLALVLTKCQSATIKHICVCLLSSTYVFVNGNGLFSVPNDIYHSLQPYVKRHDYAAAGAGTETFVYAPKDRSNFAIGIPFCDDDTFQAGIHTGGTVQVELRGSRTAICPTLYASTLPTALYVEDCILKLRAVKPSGEPQISFTHATPEQLLASAVVAN